MLLSNLDVHDNPVDKVGALRSKQRGGCAQQPVLAGAARQAVWGCLGRVRGVGVSVSGRMDHKLPARLPVGIVEAR